jgi:hypothetical protein
VEQKYPFNRSDLKNRPDCLDLPDISMGDGKRPYSRIEQEKIGSIALRGAQSGKRFGGSGILQWLQGRDQVLRIRAESPLSKGGCSIRRRLEQHGLGRFFKREQTVPKSYGLAGRNG